MYINHPNDLEDLKPSKKVTVLGNGPSLNLIPENYTFQGSIIGMNRIDKFLYLRNIKLDHYIFVSDNIKNKEWGEEWFSSLKMCAKKTKNIYISNEVFKKLKDSYPNYLKTIKCNVLNCLKEPKIYSSKASIYPSNYFTKTGTSMNLALQMAMLMNPSEIHLYGADLGWRMTSKRKQLDPNHYNKNYHARISSGFFENIRMHYIHDSLLKIFNSRNIRIKNFSPKSIISCYDIYDFYGNKIKRQRNFLLIKYLRKIFLFYDEIIREIKRTLLKTYHQKKLKNLNQKR